MDPFSDFSLSDLADLLAGRYEMVGGPSTGNMTLSNRTVSAEKNRARGRGQSDREEVMPCPNKDLEGPDSVQSGTAGLRMYFGPEQTGEAGL